MARVGARNDARLLSNQQSVLQNRGDTAMAGHHLAHLAQMLSFEPDSEQPLPLRRFTIEDIQKTASTLSINHLLWSN